MIKKEFNLSTRRYFLETLTILPLLPVFHSSRIYDSKIEETEIPERTSLDEPGPMLPPVPAILLTVRDPLDKSEEISVVWSFVINGKPPQIGISAGHEHHVRAILLRSRDFVLNVPTKQMVTAFDRVDMNSGKKGDKFKLSGFTRGSATTADAPTIAESPIQVECRSFNHLEVPPARTLFLAEVIAVSVLPGVCDENGRLMVKKVPFFGMTSGSGEFYTMGEKVGHIGMTIGRKDIKY